MSNTKGYKGQYKDFTINLELNSSNVLQLEAAHSKSQDRYSYSIDKTYLTQHTQFANIIYEPSQILEYISNNFDKVIFEGGQFKFDYGVNCKPEKITLLLQKEPSLKHIRQELAQQASEIAGLNCTNQNQDRKIQGLQEAIKRIVGDIQSLKTKDTEIDKELAGLKNVDKEIKSSIEAINGRITPLQCDVNALKLKDSNIDKKIAELEVKDKKFDENLRALDQREKKFTQQFLEADKKLTISIKELQEKYQNICIALRNLKITDVIVAEQIKKLTQSQEKDRIFERHITDKVNKIEAGLITTAAALYTSVKELNERDTAIECSLDQKIKKLDHDLQSEINRLSQSVNQQFATLQGQIAILNNVILGIDLKFTEVDKKIQAQFDEFKKQEDKINAKLLKADEEVKLQIQQISKEFRKSIDSLRCYVEEQDTKLEKKIKNLDTELDSKVNALNKRDDQQDKEIAQLQSADKQINDTLVALRLYVDEKDEKLRKDLTKEFDNKLSSAIIVFNLEIKKLQTLDQNLNKGLETLKCELRNLTAELTSKDREIDEKIAKLEKYHSEITKLLQKLVCTDKSINQEIEELKKREDQQTESVKKEIESIKKTLIQIQNTDCVLDQKIQDLGAKDQEIICKIDVSVKDLNAKINTKVDKTEFNTKISQVETKFNAQVASLKEEDKSIRAQLTKDVKQIQEKLSTKASVAEVNEKFDTLNNKVNALERRLTEQINARESKDNSIVCLIKEVEAELKKEINTKANACDVVFKAEFDKKVQEFTKKDKQLQQQIALLDTKLSASTKALQVQVKANTTDIKKIYLLFNWPYIRSIQYEDRLGNHPGNKNSQSISTERLHYNVLLVKKTTTKQGAYNFVNIYEIDRFSKARYVLKIVKANNTSAFIAFSTDACLQTQYIQKQRYIENCKQQTKISLLGRHGFGFTLNTGDQIECLADLFYNTFSFTLLNKQFGKQTVNLQPETAGKGLYLEVASQAGLVFQVIIQ